MATTGTFAKIALASTLGLALLSAPAAAGNGWHGNNGWNGNNGYYGHGYHGGGYRNNGGYVAAGVLGGLLLGGIIASSARAQEPDCWVEQRRVYDNGGRAYLRNVQVCR